MMILVVYPGQWGFFIRYRRSFFLFSESVFGREVCGRVVVPGRCEGRDAGESVSLRDSTGSSF